jgi:hypothetical protein
MTEPMYFQWQNGGMQDHLSHARAETAGFSVYYMEIDI